MTVKPYFLRKNQEYYDSSVFYPVHVKVKIGELHVLTNPKALITIAADNILILLLVVLF